MKERKEINVRLGANVQQERERAGFTQEEFSEMIGIGTQSLSAIECGVVGVSLTTLEKICIALSVPADALLFGRTRDSDTMYLARRLESLTPEQFRIADTVLMNLLEAFRLN